MIDLSQYINQKVVITLRDGKKITGTVERTTSPIYPYMVDKITYTKKMVDKIAYTKKGEFYNRRVHDYGINDYDIIHIELAEPMKKYEQLEQQIKDIQNEVDRLKKEEEEDKKNKLPMGFKRKAVLHCIKTRHRTYLSFDWCSTPQGFDYWNNIYHESRLTPFSNEAIMQLQEWVILSYQQEYEKE